MDENSFIYRFTGGVSCEMLFFDIVFKLSWKDCQKSIQSAPFHKMEGPLFKFTDFEFNKTKLKKIIFFQEL